MRAALAAAIALLLVGAAPAAAEVVTETADDGPVHAELRYDRTTDPKTQVDSFSGYHLKVTKAGATVVDSDVPDSDGFMPAGFGETPSVHAIDFDHNGTDEVVVDLYSGGAHCCYESRIYSGSAAPVTHEWRDVGYRFIKLGGTRAFLSGDPAFAGAFTSFASSRFPLQVWVWRGRMVDITSTRPVHRRLVRDTKRWRHDYFKARRHKGIGGREGVRASLAAYLADEARLRTPARGLRLLSTAVKRKELSKGQARAIRRTLRHLGYRLA